VADIDPTTSVITLNGRVNLSNDKTGRKCHYMFSIEELLWVSKQKHIESVWMGKHMA
jgi:hypothetical protein